MSKEIRVGGVAVPMAVAIDWVRGYTDPQIRTSSRPSAYPAYDTFEPDADPNLLSDGELIAHALLNVPFKLRAYYALQDMRPTLESALRDIPPMANLANMSALDVQTLTEAVYAPLDVPEFMRRHVPRTTLSKVLHRKRRQFLPLQDKNVRACYYGETGVITSDSSRSWAQGMAVFSAHVASDLATQSGLFAELDAATRVPGELTHLRLLDIVAWKANGKTPEDIPPGA